jgi:hypothetical protein
VENPVYFFDILVVIALIAGAFLVWRTTCQRFLKIRTWQHKIVVGITLIVLFVFLLHVWAQIRQLPVFVETNRPLTEKEKAWLISKGAARDFLDATNNFGAAEYSLFNGTNVPNLNWSDIHKLKQLLAWNGVLPLFPKRIEIRQDNPSSAEAYYKWMGLNRKHVGFAKDEGIWEIMNVSESLADGIEPTNFWGKLDARIPIDFKNF